MAFAGRPVETDVTPGAWLADALHPSPGRVGSLVPPTFPAFARVFHPAVRYAEDDDIDVTWAEVAAANGRTAHAAMQWASITGSWEYHGEDDQPGLWNDAPADGHLPAPVAARLAAVLARHTTTPDDCWFGVWSGFGFITADAPTLALPGREHWLVRGHIELAAANMADEPHEQSASLWWPADRAWCVATDIDLASTFVGGSVACIADVLAADGLETAAVTADCPVGRDTDRINPPPE
ncbi:MAG TPA: hypothetical protein VHF92_14095 [Geodermatophilus sp.]|nr:hypothetical protein [Geodermatophilus sp.]